MTRSRLRPLCTVAAALSTTLLVGCAADSAEPASKPSPNPSTVSQAPVAAPAKVEVIASLSDCKPKIRIEADQLREGVCRTARGDWTITTFPQEKYKETWLDAAAVYGGTYLVGPQWAIGGAKPALLKKLRADVGGELRKLSGTSGQSSAP
ncbi:hypothetical protein [Streptomyces ureilyticus]|uniref:Lipoprotein n=1 Tax=Streptomyces ureilyticus TaxID=1775131 RepID=A0ABX0DQH0_9ACTN|nr:hypothetical protein [Streptomyces ureilyticus]NGO43732.1 hypothetical protein [Streptomyces ureilyticus]